MTITLNGTTGITTPDITSTADIDVNGLTVGRGAGAVATNTAVGASALAANTSGSNSVAVGYQAAISNTTGSLNTAVGRLALSSNTGGGSNAAFGSAAMSANISGGANVAAGRDALASNTTASSNVAVGYRAAFSNTTGGSIVAIGRDALQSNTTAGNSTAVGYQAGYSNTTGTGNYFGGATAGYSTTTGSYNVYIGNGAGTSATTNGSNTFVGFNAGSANTGTANTIIGPYYNYAAGGAITTGSFNTLVGGFSGNNGGLDIRTSNNNIVLSDGAGNPRMAINSSGQVDFLGQSFKIGGAAPSIFRTDYGASGSGFHFTVPGALPTNGLGAISDNVMPLGGGSARFSTVYAGTGTINTSDSTEKQDIQDLSSGELAVAQEIKTLFKTFRWKDSVAAKGENARIHVGVIAQDVQKAFANHGLDASRYGLFCSDTWHEVSGSPISPDGIPYTAEAEGAVERTRLGIRYDQLLAFVIAAL